MNKPSQCPAPHLASVSIGRVWPGGWLFTHGHPYAVGYAALVFVIGAAIILALESNAKLQAA